MMIQGAVGGSEGGWALAMSMDVEDNGEVEKQVERYLHPIFQLSPILSRNQINSTINISDSEDE